MDLPLPCLQKERDAVVELENLLDVPKPDCPSWCRSIAGHSALFAEAAIGFGETPDCAKWYYICFGRQKPYGVAFVELRRRGRHLLAVSEHPRRVMGGAL